MKLKLYKDLGTDFGSMVAGHAVGSPVLTEDY